MGYFDESDDEEEKEETATGQNEEEDPLDAYMKTLDQNSSSAPPTKKARLDIENEDEGDWGESQERIEQPEKAEDFSDNKLSHSSAPFPKNFWVAENTESGTRWRVENSVVSALEIDPILDFSSLSAAMNGSEMLIEKIESVGYAKPTVVQSQTLPIAMGGHNCIVTAATGQGKTLAYLWPVCVHARHQEPLGANELGPLVLVLVPTRELANQVNHQAKLFASALGLRTRTVIGGQGKYILQQELKKQNGTEIVVATPGRLLDVLSGKKGLSLNRTTMVVLDEADKMLSMGFEDQVRQVLGKVRPDRQTVMLSATMGRRVERVAQEWLNRDYVRIQVGRTGQSSENVEQSVIILPNYNAKCEFLISLLPALKAAGGTIVFVAMRESCESVANFLRESASSVRIDTIHGDKSQLSRNEALRAFKRGEIDVLIGTDVAARGLDVPQVATVVCMDAPKNLDQHVHRVGRAGRLSKDCQRTGTAYTLLTPKDSRFAKVLKNSFEREGRPVSMELRQLAR